MLLTEKNCKNLRLFKCVPARQTYCEYSLIIWLDVIILTFLSPLLAAALVRPLCYYSHSAQGLAGRRFLNESKWKCQPIIAPPAERNCSQCWKFRQQFAAVSCFSRSLCRPLLQFNWIGSEPEEDKTNKVTSRYSLTLWSQVGNLTTASIGIDTTSTQFQFANVDDLVQLTFCFLLSSQSLFKPNLTKTLHAWKIF